MSGAILEMKGFCNRETEMFVPWEHRITGCGSWEFLLSLLMNILHF